MKIPNNFTSMEQMIGKVAVIQPPVQPAKSDQTKQADSISFQDMLIEAKTASEDSSDVLKFSKHANQRLSSRNIDLSKNQLERLENGAQKAREKGIKESLVMVDNLAFIVNVKNNTVVTAVNHTEEGVFTNIDGAVIS